MKQLPREAAFVNILNSMRQWFFGKGQWAGGPISVPIPGCPSLYGPLGLIPGRRGKSKLAQERQKRKCPWWLNITDWRSSKGLPKSKWGKLTSCPCSIISWFIHLEQVHSGTHWGSHHENIDAVKWPDVKQKQTTICKYRNYVLSHFITIF